MIAAAIIGWEMQRMMMVFRDNFSLGAGIQFLDFAANRPENGLVCYANQPMPEAVRPHRPWGIQQAEERLINAFRQRYPKKVTA